MNAPAPAVSRSCAAKITVYQAKVPASAGCAFPNNTIYRFKVGRPGYLMKNSRQTS